ncbi:hypothetical protein BDZ89DRAFT_1131382 [Hymenopellis radicata]|nr:hypothetical protein BDZ89DRAFT_1131382 [Hymenopellis radicata]
MVTVTRRQTTEIQAILDEAIENTLALFFFKDIYPDSAVQTKFCRDAVALATRNNDLAELIDRMAKDRGAMANISMNMYVSGFTFGTQLILQQVMNRVVNVRKETREQAGKVVAPAYGLLTLHRSTLKELTTELRKRDRSVYPLTVHAAVIQTLRLAFFTGSKSHHIVYKDCFSSSIPEKPDELEVPEPMLILSVCAVHATLGDYITGEYIHPEGSIGAFTADAARAPYLACKVLLDKIRVQPAKYHALMHGLYLRVVPASTATHGNTSDSDESDVDLDNMADDAEGYTTNDAGAGKQDDKQDTAQSGMDEK